MKCDSCENEATVHELTIKNGVSIDRHLCERCAREQGIAVQPQTPIEELLKHFVVAPQTPAQATDAARTVRTAPGTPVCPTCGLSFTDFKQTGNLGCASCYLAFEQQLSALLERAHEGACLHVGKTPKRSTTQPGPALAAAAAAGPSQEDRVRRIQTLRKQLEDAVKGEQYERAAKLRDELKRAGETGPAPGRSPAA